MKRHHLLAGALLCVLAGSPQLAAAADTGLIIGKVSTLGVGLEFVKPVNKYLGLGFGFNAFSYSDSTEESGVNYDAELDLKSFSVIADYHPGGTGFRLSGGVLLNGNRTALTAKPVSGSYEFNGVQYDAAGIGSVKGEIDYDRIAPYFGIGWGSAPKGKSGWTVDVDAGLMYHGAPNASLDVTCGPTMPDVLCTKLTVDAAFEEIQLQEAISDYRWYPVFSIGVSYKF